VSHASRLGDFLKGAEENVWIIVFKAGGNEFGNGSSSVK
jgi:hypothetical protein